MEQAPSILPPPLNAPPGRVGMEAEIELFPFSSPVRKGGVIDLPGNIRKHL